MVVESSTRLSEYSAYPCDSEFLKFRKWVSVSITPDVDLKS